ncbi:MAG: RIP metalloprotease RseP [Planctomycetaceae bacterium]
MEFLVLLLDTSPVLAASNLPGMIGNALLVILGLGMVIFFHELGHFAVAKWCGVHVERFSIGIGPILWSRQKGETEYAFSALPFGGYVKMLGQDDMDPNQMTSDEIAENPRSYSAKKVWQRMLIISAGVTMNVITGFLFFAIAYRMGVLEMSPVVGYLHPGDPAWTAGILPGDRIDSINGETVRNFTDITQSIVLSRGEIEIQGQRADGTDFSVTVTPRQGDRAQKVGIAPAATTRIWDEMPADVPTTNPGMPAAVASADFRRGDRITAINGRPVTYRHDLERIEASLADQELVYTVERPIKPADGTTEAEPAVETLEVTVPPRPMRSIGLWMAIGPVRAIIKGSNAEQAGLQVGDQITRVDDLAVGRDIDPLRLPNYFAGKAGQTVAVTVTRQPGGPVGETEKVLQIPATDAPGWVDMMINKSTPLAIPAIGAAIQIQRRIAKVVEGSEAALSGKFKVDQQITKVALERPDPKSVDYDALGNKPSPFVIDFETADQDGEVQDHMNWAYAFAAIQDVPLRDVRLYFPADSADGDGGGSVLLTKNEPATDWYLPSRGIVGFEPLSLTRKAESWGEAFGLGVGYTKSSAINIYLTLRTLFGGRLSPKELSGPVGIVSIGYQVADQGLSKLLMFLGFLSINLAVLNFLPIPILDGGHMVFLIWEGVTRRKPSARVINWAHGMGLVFIVTLFVFVLWVDFSKLLGFG